MKKIITLLLAIAFTFSMIAACDNNDDEPIVNNANIEEPENRLDEDRVHPEIRLSELRAPLGGSWSALDVETIQHIIEGFESILDEHYDELDESVRLNTEDTLIRLEEHLASRLGVSETELAQSPNYDAFDLPDFVTNPQAPRYSTEIPDMEWWTSLIGNVVAPDPEHILRANVYLDLDWFISTFDARIRTTRGKYEIVAEIDELGDTYPFTLAQGLAIGAYVRHQGYLYLVTGATSKTWGLTIPMSENPQSSSFRGDIETPAEITLQVIWYAQMTYEIVIYMQPLDPEQLYNWRQSQGIDFEQHNQMLEEQMEDENAEVELIRYWINFLGLGVMRDGGTGDPIYSLIEIFDDFARFWISDDWDATEEYPIIINNDGTITVIGHPHIETLTYDITFTDRGLFGTAIFTVSDGQGTMIFETDVFILP